MVERQRQQQLQQLQQSSQMTPLQQQQLQQHQPLSHLQQQLGHVQPGTGVANQMQYSAAQQHSMAVDSHHGMGSQLQQQ